MFKLTFRDWLWLVLVVSMGLKWWLSERALTAQLHSAHRLQAVRVRLRADLAAASLPIWGSSPFYEENGVSADVLRDE
jgi:hypothetical protein